MLASGIRMLCPDPASKLQRRAKFLSENLEKNLLWGHGHRCEDNIKIGLKDTSTGSVGCGLNSCHIVRAGSIFSKRC